MGHHSDPQVAQPISADQALAAKLVQIRGQLTTQLTTDFATLSGVGLPDVSASAVRQIDLALIAVTTSLSQVIGEFRSGALQLVTTSSLSQDLQTLAGDVVAGLMDYLAGAGGIQNGGYASSAIVEDGSSSWCCAVFCEVEYGSASTWGTTVDFHLVQFAFVIWPVDRLATEPGLPRPVSPQHWARPLEAKTPARPDTPARQFPTPHAGL